MLWLVNGVLAAALSAPVNFIEKTKCLCHTILPLSIQPRLGKCEQQFCYETNLRIERSSKGPNDEKSRPWGRNQEYVPRSLLSCNQTCTNTVIQLARQHYSPAGWHHPFSSRTNKLHFQPCWSWVSHYALSHDSLLLQQNSETNKGTVKTCTSTTPCYT